MKTIYQKAQEAMDLEITRYLDLIEKSHGLKIIKKEMLDDKNKILMFAAGIGSHIPDNVSNVQEYLLAEHLRKSALIFDVEAAVSIGIYNTIRPYVKELFSLAQSNTNNFTFFKSENIRSMPHLLPVYQSILKFSKAQLKKKVGSVSDNSISVPASEKIAELLSTTIRPNDILKESILQRIEITLEGIVRDLVGRVLFEEIVVYALKKKGVLFKREEEYSSISGVVYDFRADFVLPNIENPIAFIEVRKSSIRHASGYAKDKMFSAINWKGKHPNLIGVIIVEGEWTQATLKTMAKVFDYVIPLSESAKLAEILKKAQDGDKTILKWLITLNITESPKFSNPIEFNIQ